MIVAGRALVVGCLALLAALVTIPFARYPSVIGVDWATYRTGLVDLLDGRPLYRPELLTGPYDYLSSAVANAYNMPPWFLPIAFPIVLLPDAAERPIWTVLTAGVLVAAFGLVLPHRDRVLWAGLAGCLSFVWMTLAWGNATALVALGIALWATGLRRESTWLRVVGLVLASIKIVPVIPLGIYELQTRQWRPLAWSGAIVAALVVGLSVATGGNVLVDFAVAFANIRQVTETNIAPSILLAPILPVLDLVLIVRIVSLLALGWLATQPPSLYRIAAMELVVCGLVQNVYSFWLLHPVIVGLAAVRADEEQRAGEELAAVSASP